MNTSDRPVPVSPPTWERRDQERTTSVYRPVLIQTRDFVGFCLMRNISPSGMMGSVFADFAKGQRVSLQLLRDGMTSGTVSWSQDGKIGVHFDEAVLVEAVLRQMSEQRDVRQAGRSPRIVIACEGILEVEGVTHRIRLRDISQGGLKVDVTAIRTGDECIVRLPGLEARKATVRWTRGGLAGLNFVRPLAFEQLALWIIEQQMPPGEAGLASRAKPDEL